jgi:hypothetical protein
MDTQMLGLMQDSAARQGQFEGNAVQHLSDQQNDNLLRALGIGGSLYEGEQNRAFQGGENAQNRSLQSSLADKDAALRSRGIDLQGLLGQGDLALRGRLGEGNLNLGLASLLQGGNQFDRQLSQTGALAGQQLDTQTILALLGGL